MYFRAVKVIKTDFSMADLKSLVKDTAIYGLSSIIGRFLNYMLVPLYTHYMPKASGDYGVKWWLFERSRSIIHQERGT